MNTQHTDTHEDLYAQDWGVVGFLTSLFTTIVLWIVMGLIAIAAGDKLLVSNVMFVASVVIGLVAHGLRWRHGEDDLDSAHARQYRSRSTNWAFGWFVIVFVGWSATYALSNPVYDAVYFGTYDASTAALTFGGLGGIAYIVATTWMFASPRGGKGKWIGIAILYLAAQLLPLSVAMTRGWLDAGHSF